MIRHLKHLRVKHLRVPTLVHCALVWGALVWSGSIASAQWPDSPGKETTLQLCGNCHDATIIQAHRQSRDEWIATIQKMMAAGAEGTEEQFTAVLEYISKNFAPKAASINVNQAPAADLRTGLDLSEKEAAAIVKYRTDKGAFKTVEDLKKVPDLDYKKIEAQKDRIVF
ncbi:MAG TPA: helix-hairpin-helix domain-containing protein [Candidatus Acidoferrales bacterium]|nr:helix-hairpin-helix domain-containing protein [Candidatus Acidoferrales bacterium]